MSRKRKKPTASRVRPIAQPRRLQARPTISFRTQRAVLNRLDELADTHNVTRNDLLEAIIKTYLTERGENVAELLSIGATDDRQQALDIFS